MARGACAEYNLDSEYKNTDEILENKLQTES